MSADDHILNLIIKLIPVSTEQILGTVKKYMKRKIIKINEEKCNGCGLCVNVCAEAALKIVDGKAVLVKDFYCDGMGACLDVCPVDALKIVDEEASEYDPQKAYEHVKKERGEAEAKKIHDYNKIAKKVADEPMRCGCPGTMMRDFTSVNHFDNSSEETEIKTTSELRQWPIQLHLLTPHAPYFQNSDLIIAADCVPFSYANFHQRFLKGKILIMFCPKLDIDQEIYLEKLTEIFKTQNIKSITIARMEVPCCGGVLSLVETALQNAGKTYGIRDNIISLQGNVL